MYVCSDTSFKLCSNKPCSLYIFFYSFKIIKFLKRFFYFYFTDSATMLIQFVCLLCTCRGGKDVLTYFDYLVLILPFSKVLSQKIELQNEFFHKSDEREVLSEFSIWA